MIFSDYCDCIGNPFSRESFPDVFYRQNHFRIENYIAERIALFSKTKEIDFCTSVRSNIIYDITETRRAINIHGGTIS